MKEKMTPRDRPRCRPGDKNNTEEDDMTTTIKLIFSDGKQGGGSEDMGDFHGWREAATAARNKLARYGTVRREHNMPGGTDRLWSAPGNRAVHAEIQQMPRRVRDA